MAKIYEKGSSAIQAVIENCILEYFPKLAEFDVKVVSVLVSKHNKDDELVPCLRAHGAIANAVIRLIPARQRLHVNFDAEITIDNFTWDSLGELSKLALIYHELNHIDFALDRRTQAPKTDDLGRVKLKLKPDDFHLTGFYDVIRVFGRDALEYAAVRSVYHRTSEHCLPDDNLDAAISAIRNFQLPGMTVNAEHVWDRAESTPQLIVSNEPCENIQVTLSLQPQAETAAEPISNLRV